MLIYNHNQVNSPANKTIPTATLACLYRRPFTAGGVSFAEKRLGLPKLIRSTKKYFDFAEKKRYLGSAIKQF